MGTFKDTINQIKLNENDPSKMKVKEYYSYGIANFGYATLGTTIGGYLMQFYTAADFKSSEAAKIMSLTKVWDTINDPLFATYIDNRKPKGGRFLPFLARLAPVISILSMLMFTMPTANKEVLFVWFVITYALWETFNTFSGISFSAISTVMSSDLTERNNYLTIGNWGNKLAGAIPGLIPLVYDTINIKRTTFFLICSIFFGIVGGVAVMFTLNLKERILPPKQSENIFDSFKVFFQNRQLLLLWSSGLSNLVSNVGWMASQFFFIHSLGKFSYQTLVWTITGIPQFLVMLLAPIFLKRFKPSRITIFSNLCAGIFTTLIYPICKSVGYTTPSGIFLFFVLTFFSSIPYGVQMISSNICRVNTFDYCEYQTGKRAEATSFVTMGVMDKFLSVFTTLFGGYMLDRIGFMPGEGVVQTQQTKDGLFLYYAVFQGVGNLLSVIPYFFFKAEGKVLEDMKKELELRRQQRSTPAIDETDESANKEDSGSGV